MITKKKENIWILSLKFYCLISNFTKSGLFNTAQGSSIATSIWTALKLKKSHKEHDSHILEFKIGFWAYVSSNGSFLYKIEWFSRAAFTNDQRGSCFNVKWIEANLPDFYRLIASPKRITCSWCCTLKLMLSRHTKIKHLFDRRNCRQYSWLILDKS